MRDTYVIRCKNKKIEVYSPGGHLIYVFVPYSEGKGEYYALSDWSAVDTAILIDFYNRLKMRYDAAYRIPALWGAELKKGRTYYVTFDEVKARMAGLAFEGVIKSSDLDRKE